jgi:hypothetical protein
VRKRAARIAALAATLGALTMAIPATGQAQGLDVGEACDGLGLTANDRTIFVGDLARITISLCTPADVPECDADQDHIDLSPIVRIGIRLCLPPFQS